jgi:hypothetical protein
MPTRVISKITPKEYGKSHGDLYQAPIGNSCSQSNCLTLGYSCSRYTAKVPDDKMLTTRLVKCMREHMSNSPSAMDKGTGLNNGEVSLPPDTGMLRTSPMISTAYSQSRFKVIPNDNSM